MATNTYVALKSTTLTSAIGIVTFDLAGISGYTDLRIVVSARGTTTAYCAPNIQFNSDTSPSGTNYSWTAVFGDGSSPISYRVSNQNVISGEQIPRSNDTAGLFGLVTFDIMNYSNSTTHKTVLVRNSSLGSTCVSLAAVGLWRAASPTPITYITITSGTPNFAIGSTFTVYGIASAEQSAKATGGYITSDDTYTYHMFTSTGTLTPKQSLSADVLVIAGGGGGGYNAGGGGGAGGLRLLTAQSLTTSTAYTATVGAGGAGGSGGSGASGSVSSFAGTGLTTISASGGGQGQQQNVGNGSAGGSGGGAAKNNGTPYSGNTGGYSPVEGYAGGTGGASGAGGGGGAGGVGGNGATNGGTGGVGNTSLTSWLTATGKGISGSIAGGGGGGSDNTGGTATGGGGAGGNTNGNGTAAIANTGGGGGGGGTGGSAGSGAAGGSGIVIIRYPK